MLTPYPSSLMLSFLLQQAPALVKVPSPSFRVPGPSPLLSSQASSVESLSLEAAYPFFELAWRLP